eukprot:833837_1
MNDLPTSTPSTKGDQPFDETEKDSRLRQLKMEWKKKQKKLKEERSRLLSEFRRDHEKRGSHSVVSSLGKAEKLHREENEASSLSQAIKKDAAPLEAKVISRQKKEAAAEERQRIAGAEIELDDQKVEVRRGKSPHQEMQILSNTADPHVIIRKISSHKKENSEKQSVLEQAKVARKKKEREQKKERERLLAEIEKDRLEFKLRHGKSNPIAREEKNQKDIPAKRQYSLNKSTTPSKKTIKDGDRQVDECIRIISSYKLGGRGGECLNILRVYITNIVNNPQEKKYTRINTNNKVFKEKVKPFVGAKMLLRAVGFVHDEDRAAFVLMGNANIDLLENTKTKLESACSSNS